MIRRRCEGRRAWLWGGAAWGLLAAPLLLGDPGVASKPQRVGPNLRMNALQLPSPHGLLGRAAEAVAADADGKRLVAAWETIQGFCGPPAGERCTPSDPPGVTGYGYSTDGGRTWTDGGAPFVIEHAVTGGHPWLDRGGADNLTFFLVSRAWDVTRLRPKGVILYRGRFKDSAFAWQDGRVLAAPNPRDAWRGPSVAAAKDGSGAVFLAVINLRDVCGMAGGGIGQIEVMKSADGGVTWGKPVVVGPDDSMRIADPQDPLCGNSGTIQVAPSMALGPRGEIYVIWQFGPFLTHISREANTAEFGHSLSIRFSRSLDGGRIFSAPRDLAGIQSLRDEPPVGYSGDSINDFPRIAVAADGPHRGRIYVAYDSALREAASPPSVQCLISSQVFLIFSDDQGLSWSAPVPLGPPPPPAGVKRLWPSVAVAPGGGVDVVYAESQERQATPDPDDLECKTALINGKFRSGKVSSLVDLYWVRSRDGGVTFSAPVRVTTETSNWCTTFYDVAGGLFANYGDYLGIFPAKNRTFVVWTDGRNGVPDAYFAALQGSAPARSAGRR